MTTPTVGAPELVASQALPEMTVNEIVRYLEPGARCYTVTSTLSTPPGAPSDGARYLVGSSATDEWTGMENRIAVRMSGSWIFPTMGHGLLCFDRNQNRFLLRNSGGTWDIFTPHHELLADQAAYDALTPDADTIYYIPE